MMDWREDAAVKGRTWKTSEFQQCIKSFRLLPHTHLYEPEDSEGRRAVVTEHEADDAEELSIEAAVTETEQEAAEQGQLDTEEQHREATATDGVSKTRGMAFSPFYLSLFPFMFATICLIPFWRNGLLARK